MIFQSTYKETTQIKSSKIHGNGYMAKYRTRKELIQENLEVHARVEAAATERNIAFEVEVQQLQEQIANEAAEREREREENRRKMQEDLENAKEIMREQMKQELLNMLAQHKEGTLNMVIFLYSLLILCAVNKLLMMMMPNLLGQLFCVQSALQNNDSTKITPTIEEEHDNAKHGNDGTQIDSLIPQVLPIPTLSSK